MYCLMGRLRRRMCAQVMRVCNRMADKFSERYGGLSMENSKLNHTENQNTEVQNTETSKIENQSKGSTAPKRKPAGEKDGVAKVLDFVREHIRYFAAGALLVVLVLVLAMCARPGTGGGIGQASSPVESTETEAAEEAYQVDAYEEVNALISQYYTAYASGDLATLTAIATPVSENEQSYIALFGQYVDEYQNIKCYTKSGLDENSYLVSVSMEIKFTGVDTPAPGLDFFYIRTNDEGMLYIDNLYSQYNLANQENALDTSVQSLIYEFENEADVLALQSEVQERYDAALAADANLSTMIETTIPGAIKDWVAQVTAQNAQADAGQTEVTENADGTNEAPGEDANNSDTTFVEEPQETDDAGETTQTEQLATTDRVNVRAGADTSSEKLGTVEQGTVVTRIGVEGDWSKIDYNGTTGYIKNEYLTYDTSGTAANAGDEAAANTDADNGAENAASLAEGTVITLQDSVNVRSGMSEDADRLGTAYTGEKVTVVMSYAEGWTKVKWNGETGYIKTSLLQ